MFVNTVVVFCWNKQMRSSVVETSLSAMSVKQSSFIIFLNARTFWTLCCISDSACPIIWIFVCCKFFPGVFTFFPTWCFLKELSFPAAWLTFSHGTRPVLPDSAWIVFFCLLVCLFVCSVQVWCLNAWQLRDLFYMDRKEMTSDDAWVSLITCLSLSVSYAHYVFLYRVVSARLLTWQSLVLQEVLVRFLMAYTEDQRTDNDLKFHWM